MISYEKTVIHLESFNRTIKAVSNKISGFTQRGSLIYIELISNLTAQEQTNLDIAVNAFQDVYDPIHVNELMIEYQVYLGSKIIEGLKLKNRIENITDAQSAHYLSRTESILTMLREGLIQSARDLAVLLTPDSMIETYHFLTQARIDDAVADIDAALVLAAAKLTELTT